MGKEYKPHYADCEVIVEFKVMYSGDRFVKPFLLGLGFEFVESHDRYPYTYIVKTNPGEEETTVGTIEGECANYIEGTWRRDLESERRHSVLNFFCSGPNTHSEKLEGLLEGSEDEWNECLSEIQAEIEKAKI